MKRFIVGTLALAIAGATAAAGPGAVRKQIEASMLVTGDIVVATDGSVASYTLDKPDMLPADVVTLIGKGTKQWHFQPVLVDGKPVNAKARMSIRVVAQRSDTDVDSYVARITGATFGEYDANDKTHISYVERKPPRYPDAAVRGRVEGTVYVALRIDHSGHVVDATAEQVNLEIVASERDMREWRKVLADPTVSLAKEWTFRPPTEGPHANDPYYVVRVPVVYRLNQIGPGARPSHGYGEWEAYVPGPKAQLAWGNDTKDAGNGVDALPDGQLALAGSGLKLVTPLGQG